jgi:subtilisin family serine protease
MWTKNLDNGDATDDEVIRMTTDANRGITATGKVTDGGATNFMTIGYDENGEVIFQQTFDGTFGNDIPSDIHADLFGNYFVVGSEFNGTDDVNTVIKYAKTVLPYFNHLNSSNDPDYVADEVIICFNPTVINTNFTDDMGVLYAPLNEVVDDSIITKIENATKLPLHENPNDYIVSKIFPNFTSTITTSISRIGDTVKVPCFFSTVLLHLPTGLLDSIFIDTMNTLHPDIFYTELNLTASFSSSPPNDPVYAGAVNHDQASLHPTAAFPNGNINIEPAWNVDYGKNIIKVAIVDSGLDYRHEDFGGSGASGTLSGTNIISGKDYITGASLQSLSNPDAVGHGTSCAGIIGASRNNSKGIAGIAGGDFQASPTAFGGNTGVSLLGLKIDNAGTPDLAKAASAFVDASASNIFAVNVINFSAGTTTASYPYWNESKKQFKSHKTLTNAVRFSNRNAVTLAAARGNNGNDNVQYPACYPDNWVLNCGASGTDGFWENFSNGASNYSSSFGKDVDIVAPGDINLVESLQKGTISSYNDFDGTSSATPHTAGVAALLMSAHNQFNPGQSRVNLAPEDVENIIEVSATHRTPSGAPTWGYDVHNGFGLLDAGGALSRVQYPDFNVLHFDGFSSPSAVSAAGAIANNAVMTMKYATNPNVKYHDKICADVYQVTVTLYHTLPTSTTQLWGCWVRNSACDLLDNNDGDIKEYANVRIDQYDGTSITLTGFGYRVSKRTFGICSSGTADYFPFDVTSTPAKFAYSLLTYDPNANGVESLNSFLNSNISIFPNPASNSIELSTNLDLKSKKVSISVVDVLGRNLIVTDASSFASNNYKVDISALSAGLYFATVKVDDTVITKKFVKN